GALSSLARREDHGRGSRRHARGAAATRSRAVHAEERDLQPAFGRPDLGQPSEALAQCVRQLPAGGARLEAVLDCAGTAIGKRTLYRGGRKGCAEVREGTRATPP